MIRTMIVRRTPLVPVPVMMVSFAVATIADTMADWTGVGRSKIVNLYNIPKDVVTLELRNVRERLVPDILLRAPSGFIVALRDAGDPNALLFDCIFIMPPSAPPPVVNARAVPAYPPTPASTAASVSVVSMPPQPQPLFTTNSRQMLEMVTPLDFHLPDPGRLGAMAPPEGEVPPVVPSARPGVIVLPAPNPPDGKVNDRTR